MANPGRLRDRIILQKKAEASGPFQPIDEYEDYKKIWAEAKYLTGRNLYAARAANVKTEIEFIIRHRSDIDETMRVKYNNKYYNIEGVLSLDRMYMTIKAYEIKYDM